MSIAELAQAADIILAGTVAKTSTEYIDSTIVTRVALTAIKQGKGPELRDSIEIRQLGGRIGRRELIGWSGPAFLKGARYVLLLRESLGSRGDHFSPVIGYEQSWFQVRSVEGRAFPVIVDRHGREVVEIVDRHLVLAELAPRREHSQSEQAAKDSAIGAPTRRTVRRHGAIALEIVWGASDPGTRVGEHEFLRGLGVLGAGR